MHGRRIAITSEGYPVIVPRSAQLEDLIVALYGIRLFFVIRLQLDLAENSGCYTLVGACELSTEIFWRAFESDLSQLQDLLIV